MKIIKSITDVEQLHIAPLLCALMQQLLVQLQDAYSEGGYEYNPAEDGYLVLIEEKDSEEDIMAQLGHKLIDAVFEGVHYEDGCFVTCTLPNNQFGITWVIPNEGWLDNTLRKRLQQECETREILP